MNILKKICVFSTFLPILAGCSFLSGDSSDQKSDGFIEPGDNAEELNLDYQFRLDMSNALPEGEIDSYMTPTRYDASDISTSYYFWSLGEGVDKYGSSEGFNEIYKYSATSKMYADNSSIGDYFATSEKNAELKDLDGNLQSTIKTKSTLHCYEGLNRLQLDEVREKDEITGVDELYYSYQTGLLGAYEFDEFSKVDSFFRANRSSIIQAKHNDKDYLEVLSDGNMFGDSSSGREVFVCSKMLVEIAKDMGSVFKKICYFQIQFDNFDEDTGEYVPINHETNEYNPDTDFGSYNDDPTGWNKTMKRIIRIEKFIINFAYNEKERFTTYTPSEFASMVYGSHFIRPQNRFHYSGETNLIPYTYEITPLNPDMRRVKVELNSTIPASNKNTVYFEFRAMCSSYFTNSNSASEVIFTAGADVMEVIKDGLGANDFGDSYIEFSDSLSSDLSYKMSYIASYDRSTQKWVVDPGKIQVELL